MSTAISQAIARGLVALGEMQADDGSFPLFLAERNRSGRRIAPLYATSCVMMAGGQRLPPARIAAAARFVREQQQSDGLWHWDPTFDMPADSDTTACAIAALRIMGVELEPEVDAARLRRFWRTDFRQFRMWEGEGDWRSTVRDDPVGNCNVVYALDLLGYPATPEELTGVRALVRRSRQGARYYYAPATIAYAARRAGLGIDDPPPVATAKPMPADIIGAAVWLCGMGRADADLVDALLAAQRTDGAWPMALWIKAVGLDHPRWGSRAVTTALAIEALSSLE